MKRTVIAGAFLSLLLLAMPQYSFAASNPTFLGPIVPQECHCNDQPNPNGGGTISTAPDFGCVMQTVQNVINFAVTVAIILFTIYLLIAGLSFLTSGGSPESISKARTRLTNVIIGLAVLLLSWLIVDYVMKTVYDEGSFGPWNSIISGKADQSDRCIVAKAPTSLAEGTIDILLGKNIGSTAVGPSAGSVSGTVLNDSQTRSALTSGGVSIAKFSGTATMANTRADTVNQVIAIKKACGCSVQVNSTTGGTHKATGAVSHSTGYKVDLQPNAALDAFLKSLNQTGSRKDGTKLYKDRCGNEYARESSHWDITINKGVCSI